MYYEPWRSNDGGVGWPHKSVQGALPARLGWGGRVLGRRRLPRDELLRHAVALRRLCHAERRVAPACGLAQIETSAPQLPRLRRAGLDRQLQVEAKVDVQGVLIPLARRPALVVGLLRKPTPMPRVDLVWLVSHRARRVPGEARAQT